MRIGKEVMDTIRVSHSLRLECPPGKLPADGSYVSALLFPELFAAIGRSYQPLMGDGSRDQEGHPITYFKLPHLRGKFIEPVDVGSSLGVGNGWDATDRATAIKDHPHNVTMQPAAHGGSHPVSLAEYVGSGGNFGRGQDTFIWYSGWEASGGQNFLTTTDGSHFHTVNVGAMVSPGETRPKNIALPTYISAGRWSDRAILYVPDGLFTTFIGYNEVPTAWDGCAEVFAKHNIHVYRAAYPAASSGSPSYPEAVEEIERQITLLGRLYPKLYVIGSGSGANVAAKALESVKATKYVGVNGIYNFSSNVTTDMYNNHVNVYLGTTDSGVRASASPSTPSIPYRVWHGADNTTIASVQATAWAGSNAVVKANLVQDASLLAAGVAEEILSFLDE